MKDKTFVETDMQYHNGVCINEYQGEFEICRANKKDGTVYIKWGFPQVGKDKPADKAIPWKVVLGSKSQAIEMLETFVSILKSESKGEPAGSGTDDIPF